MKLILALIVAVGLTACGKDSETFGGKFGSISACLEKTQTHANSKISFVATDEPGKVTGKLANGATFGCVLKATGTQGTFVEGWYTI